MVLSKQHVPVYLILLLCCLYFTLDLNTKESLLKLGRSHEKSRPLSAMTTVTSFDAFFLHNNYLSSNHFEDELEKALSKAAKINKTLIISIVNKAYVEGDKPMLDLFLDGFWLGEDTRHLTGRLLIVAMDQTSYDRCKFLRLHCYKLETDGVDFGSEKFFMSVDFIKMMWRRTSFIRDVLRRGYNFIFTDVDVLWLRNPFPYLASQPVPDLQISTDNFTGNEWSSTHPINTGFYMIQSNNKTIALFDAWYGLKDTFPWLKEQDVLQILINKGWLRKLGLRAKFLDTVYFSGFCQISRNATLVATVHANCCRGLTAKLADLTTIVHDWKRYKRSSANKRRSFWWTGHRACWGSWKPK